MPLPTPSPMPYPQYPKPGTGGMFSSLISTYPALSTGEMRSASRQPQAYRSYGMGAGNQSRTAQARAMADMNRNSLSTGSEKFNREYQTKAEQARSGDIFAQRQNEFGQYNLGLNAQQTLRQQEQQRDLGTRQIDQYVDLARQRRRTQLTGEILGAVAGTNLLGRFAQPVGEAMAGGASLTGGLPQVPGRSGLLGSLYTANANSIPSNRYFQNKLAR